jgi:hypothetical protein
MTAADTIPKFEGSGGAMSASVGTRPSYARAKQQVIVTDNDVAGLSFELAPVKDTASAGPGSSASTD